MRQPVEKVGGAVERIDDPAEGLVAVADRAALLQEKAEARPGTTELAPEPPMFCASPTPALVT